MEGKGSLNLINHQQLYNYYRTLISENVLVLDHNYDTFIGMYNSNKGNKKYERYGFEYYCSLLNVII